MAQISISRSGRSACRTAAHDKPDTHPIVFTDQAFLDGIEDVPGDIDCVISHALQIVQDFEVENPSGRITIEPVPP